MSKKRKIKIGRLILIIVIIILLIACGLASYYLIYTKKKEAERVPFNINSLHINEIDYSESKTLDLELNSKEYLLIRLNDFKVLYASGNSNKIYPASLTKVLTLDSLFSICEDTNDVSYFTNSQYNDLIEQNASLAYLTPEKDYTIKELLYALILPSGGDAAVAISNYVTDRNSDLIDLMNDKCKKLNLSSSHFTNPTGLHDDDLYTSLDDYSKIVIDTLLDDEAKEVLKTMEYQVDENRVYKSSLSPLLDRQDRIKVLGGKTGYTIEAGMNILVLYEVDNRSYMLLLANAEGSPYRDGLKHIDDVNNIFNFLYN